MSYFKVVCIASSITLALGVYQPAYAYLDPGTGSIIIQSVIGGIAAAATFGAIYWSKLKELIHRCFGKKTPDDKPNEGSDNK